MCVRDRGWRGGESYFSLFYLVQYLQYDDGDYPARLHRGYGVSTVHVHEIRDIVHVPILMEGMIYYSITCTGR